jgi:hypothetical protein
MLDREQYGTSLIDNFQLLTEWSKEQPRRSAKPCSQQLRFKLPGLPDTDVKTALEIRIYPLIKMTDRLATVCLR